MFRKFYINADDIPMCSVENKRGETVFFAMSEISPVLINPVEILPGKAGEISREEFMKIANPSAVKSLEYLLM